MKPLTLLLAVILFSIFGFIGAYQQGDKWIIIGFAAALGLIAIVLLQVLLVALNPVAKKDHLLVHTALLQGLAYMLPFAGLAVLADAVLGWQSAHTFFSAGLSTLAITSGGVLLKQGGSKWGSVFVPLLWSMAITTAWILVVALYK